MKPLFVINPNSSVIVTAGIDAAMEPLRRMGVPIQCMTLEQGPPAIENQMEADLTIAPMLALAQGLAEEAGGFVVACFGDPGVRALRCAVSQPVVGIQEAAVATALTLGQRFGVISILPASIPRHMRSFGAMGVMDRLAGDRALGLGVADLAHEGRTLEAMVACGQRLRDDDGADVLIMGCAGMAIYRHKLEEALGLPVVEPCQAGAALAIGQMMMGYGRTLDAD